MAKRYILIAVAYQAVSQDHSKQNVSVDFFTFFRQEGKKYSKGLIKFPQMFHIVPRVHERTLFCVHAFMNFDFCVTKSLPIHRDPSCYGGARGCSLPRRFAQKYLAQYCDTC